MAVFGSEQELRGALLGLSPTEFFERFVAGAETPYFSDDKLDFVSEVLLEEYGIRPSRAELVVVGSSKLGFALHDKVRDGRVVANAFRSFDAESDIDLSICSPELFNLLWHEISAYFCKQQQMPFRHKKFGDYLAYGWLRPDQIPHAPAPNLVKCDNLRFVRGKVRKNRQRGHPKVDFGVFHDFEHLRLYQIRSIHACRQSLENPL